MKSCEERQFSAPAADSFSGSRQMLGCVLLSLLLSFCLFAQADRGTLTGTVTDPQGAVIPEAKISIRNSQTGADYATGDDLDGQLHAGAVAGGPI
jgi:hypothetical protein